MPPTGSRSSPAARVKNQQTLLYPCRCGIPAERWYRHRLLHAFLRSIRRGEATHASPVITFIREVGLSTLLGFLLARIVIWFITRINSEEMVQNSVIILAAYLTFILFQYYLGVSGVIALVAFGLTVTYVGKPG